MPLLLPVFPPRLRLSRKVENIDQWQFLSKPCLLLLPGGRRLWFGVLFWLISRVLIFPFGFPANPFEGQGLRGVTDPLVNRWVSLEIDAWYRDHPSLAYAIATAKISSCSQSHRRPNHKPKAV